MMDIWVRRKILWSCQWKNLIEISFQSRNLYKRFVYTVIAIIQGKWSSGKIEILFILRIRSRFSLVKYNTIQSRSVHGKKYSRNRVFTNKRSLNICFSFWKQNTIICVWVYKRIFEISSIRQFLFYVWQNALHQWFSEYFALYVTFI